MRAARDTRTRRAWRPLASLPLATLLLTGSLVAQPADPVLFFSDLTSGPATGNGDDSGGRVAGRDGAIVTVWGRNLGTSAAGLAVSCGGAPAGSVYRLEEARSPADLFTYHRMQRLSFQVSQAAAAGTGPVTVTVGGRTSNALSFTVRDGRILFVKASGSDEAGDGSWARPWRTIPRAVASMRPGDVTYVGDGVDQTAASAYEAAVPYGASGEPGRPKALVVYPGATSRAGAVSLGRAFFAYDGDLDRPSEHWVVSGFTVTTSEVGVQAFSGSRVVGNRVTAPSGDGLDGAIGVWGSDVAVLGNELTGVGSAQSSKLYHAIYLNGTRRDDPPRAPAERNREVGWNYLHDNLCNRAVNAYSEQAQSAYLEGHRIHDNVIVNQHGDGILLGSYVTGENAIVNNLVVRAGLGPEWPDDTSSHAGIRIAAGHETVAGTTVLVAHNTVVGCGYPGGPIPDESGQLYVQPEALPFAAVTIRDNVVVSTGTPYMAPATGAIPPHAGRNLYSGAGAAPAWDTAAIVADPAFADAAGNDFQLASGSPAVDAGTALSPPIARDLLGVPRPQGSAPDLGAYERVASGGSTTCTADATTLCLNASRFRVTATFRDYAGRSGAAQAVPLTADTGYFWFFARENVESVVKLLDFCGLNGRWALYATGLTDVEVSLTATDTATGASKSYANPLGTPFVLVRDAPFACP